VDNKRWNIMPAHTYTVFNPLQCKLHIAKP
jgi:hypothetical protein